MAHPWLVRSSFLKISPESTQMYSSQFYLLVWLKLAVIASIWPHVPIKVDTINKNPLILQNLGCHFQNVLNFWFQGLSPVGVSQWPSQSVSLTVNLHLRGLTVNPFSTSLVMILSNNVIWCFNVWLKGPISSIHTYASSILRIIFLIACSLMSGKHISPIIWEMHLH